MAGGRILNRNVTGQAVAAALCVLTALAAPGAVHAHGRSPTVLTMDVADLPGSAYVFASAVDRLSKGALAIHVIILNQITAPRADGELVVIRNVQQGAASMGWIPTRAWDAVGVSAFAPVQAPFLITNYALLRKVLEGPVGRGMRAGTRASGVRTLGLAAVDLHIPLGARRPLVRVQDFRGATIRVPSNSRLTSAILEALGGKAVSITSGPDLLAALSSGTVDGAISALYPILLNGYARGARYLTMNLTFFPVVASIGINERAFEALPPSERAVLTKAAAETMRASFKGIRARDQEQLRLVCASGIRAATSSEAQRTALRRAVQPVYALLSSDRATAARIAKIQALKKKVKPPRPLSIPKGCA
jgi:C4-dicarboxylate-binding protein DctP